MSSWPCIVFKKGAFGHLFCKSTCWFRFVYSDVFLLLSSWLGILLKKVAFGHLFSITPAGFALCTVVGSCSSCLGLAWSSVKGCLRPPFFNNPCWFCFVYCNGFMLLSSWPCMAFKKVAFGDLFLITILFLMNPNGTILGPHEFRMIAFQIPLKLLV